MMYDLVKGMENPLYQSRAWLDTFREFGQSGPRTSPTNPYIYTNLVLSCEASIYE